MKFFDRQSKYGIALQIYNIFLFLVALYTLTTDENASKSELGADAIVHSASALILSQNDTVSLDLLLVFLNCARMGQIIDRLVLNTSTIPLTACYADIFNHLLNSAASYLYISSSKYESGDKGDESEGDNDFSSDTSYSKESEGEEDSDDEATDSDNDDTFTIIKRS